MKTGRLLLAGLVALAVMMGGAAAHPQTASAVDLFPNRVCQTAGSGANRCVDVCQGRTANSAACSASGRDTLTGPRGVIMRATNLVAIVGGIAAVIALMIGGFFFITAGGDSGKLGSAKKTITYAIAGLIVIALARTIIVFVISRF